MVLKVSPCYIYNIYNSTRSDWLWAPYFLNYFELELFDRDGTFIKNVSFVETRKNVVYLKLVNNPFKYYCVYRLFASTMIVICVVDVWPMIESSSSSVAVTWRIKAPFLASQLSLSRLAFNRWMYSIPVWYSCISNR